MSDQAFGWSFTRLCFRYAPDRTALDDVTARIAPGRCTALLGPNGSGKSTLVRLLVGTLKPTGGEVKADGRSLGEWSRRDLARAVGVVPQNEEITFPLPVRELVGMGRYPHLGTLRLPGPADHRAVERAMEHCDILDLADRDFNALSGGERQRARLARALAQEPRALVLDEPTLALDVRHEMEIFELVRELSRSGVTVLVATHNLNLAARYADDLLMLDRGQLVATGDPEEVLRRDRLERVYRWPLVATRHPGPGPDAGAVQITPLARSAAAAIDDATRRTETPNLTDR